MAPPDLRSGGAPADRAAQWTLPHDRDAEASILGGVLLRNELLARLDTLEVDDFYDHKHKVVYQAIRNLEAKGRPIDVVLLEHEITRSGKLEAIGGVAFLGELTCLVPTPDNVEHYRDIVQRDARNRRVMVELGSALERARRGVYEPGELLGETIGELQRLAETQPKAARPAIGRTWESCVAEVYARKDEPWIDVRIGGTVIASCRNGSFVPLVAPSGAGKSTLALQMLIDHALRRGPAIYVTYELDGDEAVARGIGQLCSFSWSGVLRGEVPRAAIPRVDRIRVLERDDATLANLGRVVAEFNASHPNESILVVVDYLQASPAEPGKERGHTANVSADLRRAAKQNRVVLIGVSQASTDNSKKMRSGELLGIDSAATGAETAQIERDAYVILTLGDRRKVDHETVAWRLSVAKYRFGEPDLVYELHYRGRIGSWEVIGDPATASEVRDARDLEKNAKKRAELVRSITALVQDSPRPLSKKEITDASTGNDRLIGDVIKQLLREGVVEHVAGVSRGGAAPIWWPEKIRKGDS